MSNRSSMFLRNLTAIDYAYLDEGGVPVGGSFHVNATVSGEIDPIEKVVVDFSTIKSDLKRMIDHSEKGFDHKFWYIKNLSHGDVVEDMLNKEIRITSPSVMFLMPSNAVRFFDHTYLSFDDNAAEAIEFYLQTELEKLYPKIDIEIDIELHRTNFANHDHTFVVEFNYVHGLKDSTSWGCQNHSHGHSSFIEFTFLEGCNKFLTNQEKIMLMEVVEEMNGAVFIFEDNIVIKDGDYTSIGYKTARGVWVAAYYEGTNNVVVLDTETTIENIVKWFVKRNLYVLNLCGVEQVFISEGLAKGAVETVSDFG